jgi:cobalamin biosynthesis Mg chelatase CobN
VFGTSPGDYSAGINRAVERSGSWNDRKELAKIYIDRIGHAYSADGTSQAQQGLLKSNLREVTNTYLGRSSNLYGLMDNNDAFDYLGGLSLAVETLSGRVPASHVADHSNPSQPTMQPLPTALLSELRGRYLNPAWIKPLMQRVHGVLVGLAGHESGCDQELGVGRGQAGVCGRLASPGAGQVPRAGLQRARENQHDGHPDGRRRETILADR